MQPGPDFRIACPAQSCGVTVRIVRIVRMKYGGVTVVQPSRSSRSSPRCSKARGRRKAEGGRRNAEGGRRKCLRHMKCGRLVTVEPRKKATKKARRGNRASFLFGGGISLRRGRRRSRRAILFPLRRTVPRSPVPQTLSGRWGTRCRGCPPGSVCRPV